LVAALHKRLRNYSMPKKLLNCSLATDTKKP
jgi:hypothetical protein